MFKFSLSTLLFIMLFSCSNSNEMIEKTYYGKLSEGNGNIATEVTLINNKIEGEVKYYYPNGKLKLFANIFNGIGKGFELKENGDTLSKSTYAVFEHFGNIGIKKHGWVFEFKNNKIITIESFNEGYRHGLSISYDNNGKVKNRGMFIFGAKDGLWIENNDSIVYKNDKQMFLIKNGKLIK